MSTKISVIIPVYNAEKYLADTLDSVLNQSFTDFEVIAVNDGSNDSSLEILKEYSVRHGRIKVIDKRNTGVSDTRNIGIENADGEYICFVDSDDLVSKKYLEDLYEAMQENNSDVVLCNYRTFYNSKNINLNDINKVYSTRLENDKDSTAFMKSMSVGLGSSSCTRLIKLKLLREYNIKYDIKMTFGEDMFFNWKVCAVSESISSIDKVLYFYRQCGDSAIVRFHPELFQNYKKGFCDIIKFFEDHNVGDELAKKEVYICFTKRLASFLRMIIRDKCSIGNKRNQIKEILSDDMFMKALREYKDEVYKNEPKHAVKMYDAACEGSITGLMISGMKYEYRLQWGRKIKNLLRKLK